MMSRNMNAMHLGVCAATTTEKTGIVALSGNAGLTLKRPYTFEAPRPDKVTLAGYEATHTAVQDLKGSQMLPTRVCARTGKYLDNLVEQDHRCASLII
jgi:hypothetical protein